MTDEELSLLSDERFRQEVERHLNRDPAAIALDKRIPNAGLVATQVRNLQRAVRKLPSYYRARCILPTRALEQASSEAAAAARRQSGSTCIDLTCGLGSDALALSKRFRKVVTVEADPLLARTARLNFRLLGADNIEVVCSRAEDFVQEARNGGLKADFVIVDPDRRSETGRRLYSPASCSPDVFALMPSLETVAKRIAVKNSPMYDADEAFRAFGPDCFVTLVSVGGECKELTVEVGNGIAGQTVAASAVAVLPEGKYEIRHVEAPYPIVKPEETPFSPPYSLLAVPDAAVRAARLTDIHLKSLLPDPGQAYRSTSGYVLLRDGAEGFIGRVFEISFIKPYRPQQLRKELAARGIRSAEILAASVSGGARRALQQLGLKEGSGCRLALLPVSRQVWVIGLNGLYL